jgi:hypothetical protein
VYFPKHWHQARNGPATGWGWSDESPEAARTEAERRAARVLEWLKQGFPENRGRYGYPDRPMREEVLREFRDADGSLKAAVSRNSYGCLVLNTADALFLDIDGPESKESNFLAGLFGFRRPDKNRKAGAFEAGVTEGVQRWLRSHPDWGWRLYQTRAGFRLLATHQPVKPDDAAVDEAFRHFNADPLYQKLCANQKCFRARLTPKPWRCGVGQVPARWPWPSEKAEARFREWEADYLASAGAFATCRLVGHLGNPVISPAIQELVDFHDKATRAEVELPLA